MKERFEGYSVSSMKAKRIAHGIAMCQSLGAVRRVIRSLLFVSSATFFAIAVSLFLSERAALTALLPVLFVFLALWTLYAVFLLVFRRWACATPRKMEGLATQYVRILLVKTLARYRKEILAVPKHGNAVYYYAHEYAITYIPTSKERGVLLEKGKLRYEGEELRLAYERFLREIVSFEDKDASRYLEMREKLEDLIVKWRQRRLPRYDKTQVPYIEENIALLRREVTDRRQEFLDTNGFKAYMHLLEKLTVYRYPDEEGRLLLIPTKERHEAFSKIVKKLDSRDYKPNLRDPKLSQREDLLLEYECCMNAYEDFVKHFAVLGYGKLDDPETRKKWYEEHRSGYEKAYQKYKDLFGDERICGFCKFKKRLRVRCAVCNGYICDRCGRCHCDNNILLDLFR